MKTSATLVRWTARLLGLAAVVQFARTFPLFQGGFTLSSLLDHVDQPLLALAIMIIGVLGAWKAELAGGLVALFGAGVLWYMQGTMPGGYIMLFPLAGCLYLIAWLLDHKPGAPKGPKTKTIRASGKVRRGRTART